MAERKKGEQKPSRADLLIEEAIKAVEAREDKPADPKKEISDELVEREPSRDSGAIAKIDLQKFIDKEAYMRLAADFENFRRRALKDRQDAEKVGREKVLRGFLEILDNLDRGIKQADMETGALADGIRMVMAQIDSWMKTEGLDRIQAFGQPFDPELHEAVAQAESEVVPNGHVMEEVRRGYRWSDRLLRPAAVVVCKKGES